MSEYYLVDMFATKGPEYLVVIVFLVAVVPFWRLLNSRVVRPQAVAAFEAGRYFDRTHTWSFLDPDGNVRIGIDTFLANIMGAARISSDHAAGESIHRGDPLLTIQHEGKQIAIPSPVNGVIKQSKAGTVINKQDPRQWLVSLKPKQWEQDQQHLIAGSGTTDWIRQETARLRDFMAFTSRKYNYQTEPVTLADGGELRSGLFEDLPEDIWKEFQSEFIDAVMEL